MWGNRSFLIMYSVLDRCALRGTASPRLAKRVAPENIKRRTADLRLCFLQSWFSRRKLVSVLLDRGPEMWGNDRVEASSTGGERIHPRQNKGVRSLLREQGSCRQASKAGTVCDEASGGGCFSKGKVRGAWVAQLVVFGSWFGSGCDLMVVISWSGSHGDETEPCLSLALSVESASDSLPLFLPLLLMLSVSLSQINK